MALVMDKIFQIDQRPEIIDAMQLNRYEKTLKKMMQQADVKSYHHSQEGIGRGHEVQGAKQDTRREEAPFGLDHPSKEQFLGKARPERDKADIDQGGRGKDGLDLAPHHPSHRA